MTPGALVQFVIYSVIVAGAVAALSEIWGELQRAAGATERMVELIEAADTVRDPAAPVALPAPVRGRHRLRGRDLPLSGAPGDRRRSTTSTLRIAPGETVALVGPSGAGKTTIFQLLLRFFDPDAGRRHARRHRPPRRGAQRPPPVSSRWCRRSRRSSPPRVRENIRFGRPEASDAEVEAAARAAAAHDFVARLPQGYDTWVGERGVMLSGGQKQRLAIARAILRDAPVLLLDEATSALDAESERAVQQAVERLAAGTAPR